MCISEEDKAVIVSSCKWAKFLAITSFVMMGLLVLISLILLLTVAVAGQVIPGISASYAVTLFIIVIVAMIIDLFPLIYLYRYASKGLQAVEAEDSASMTESFLNIKRYFKFTGVLVIVILSLYVLLGIAAGLSGALSHM